MKNELKNLDRFEQIMKAVASSLIWIIVVIQVAIGDFHRATFFLCLLIFLRQILQKDKP